MTAEEFKKEWCNGFSLDNDQIENLMKEYAKLKCEELLKIVAEKSEIIIEKRPQYGKSRKWQKVKKDELVDLLDYEVSHSVNKDSILNAVDLNEFIK